MVFSVEKSELGPAAQKKRRSISHCLCKTRFKTSLWKKRNKTEEEKKKERKNIQSAALFLSAAGKA